MTYQLEERINVFLDTKFRKYPEVEREANRILAESK
jgi:hypothetical protein